MLPALLGPHGAEQAARTRLNRNARIGAGAVDHYSDPDGRAAERESARLC
jgi:hypothetical protein